MSPSLGTPGLSDYGARMSDANYPPPPPPPGQPPYGGPPPGQPPYGGPPPGQPPYGAPPPGPAVPYAEWPQRALAWLIDQGPILVLYVIAAIAGSTALMLLVVVAALGWGIYNYGVQQGTTGYTLGKGIVGIKLVSEPTGQPVGTGLAIGRMFVHIIDGIPCYIGYLWPLWDAKKQTFTDKVLTQIVIQAPKA